MELVAVPPKDIAKGVVSPITPVEDRVIGAVEETATVPDKSGKVIVLFAA